MVAKNACSFGCLFLFIFFLSACSGNEDLSTPTETGNPSPSPSPSPTPTPTPTPTPSPTPTPPPSDTTAPIPTGSTPSANEAQVNVGAVIVVSFNEPVALSSLDTNNFALNPAVPGSFSVSGSTARFTPSNPLAATTRYTVTLRGIRDLANNVMTGTYSFSFTTAAALTSNCLAIDVLCVDDTAGAMQEYSDIQTAISAVQAGQTVLVHDGIYTGFELVNRTGTPTAPIVIRAAGTNAVISSSTSTGDGIRLHNSSYITVEGFLIQGGANVANPITARCIAARGATATAPMLGNILRGNRCTDAGLECFYLSQFGNGLIENNFIRGCGRAGGIRNHGIYLANAGSDNTVIRRNTISTTNSAGNESNGIHMNGDLSIGGDGLISGVLIDANTIHNNTQNGINLDGVQNTTLRNNLVYGNARHAVRAYDGDGAAGPRALVAVNNTLLATTTGWAMKISEDGGGHTFFNNILLGVSGSLCLDNPSFRSDHNVVDNRLSLNNETSIITLSDWRTQSNNQDINSFVDNASSLFLNSSGNDHRLASASAARDAGITNLNNISAPTVDISGTARPQDTRVDLGAFEAMSGGGITHYLASSPAGSDTNPGTSAQPWATFTHAFGRMQPGQVLEVKNGEYAQDLGTWRWSGGNMIPVSQPPNGNPNAPTIVRGESVGGVTINGSLNVIGWSHVNVENFTFNNGGTIDGGARYIEVRRSGFNGGIGTAHSSYILKEDIWAWGSNRYVISNYQADHIVDHRVIARLDNLGSAPALPVGAISQYETNYSVIAHGLFFDVTGTFQQPYALVYSSRPPLGMNRLYGLIGFNAGPQLGGIYPGDAGGGGHEINNSVIHGTVSYGVTFNSPGPNQVLNSTIFGNSGAAITGHHNITASNNILLNNAGGISATIVSCSNNLLAASGSMGNCTGNDTTTVPSILYLPRSPIAGKGASIESRYNIGLLNGEYTINATTDRLWPWPHEAIIKRDMCAGSTYGWCGTNKTLTRYIWEFLGNPCPTDICS